MNAGNVIAVCALFLTLYGLWATRKHYRLSVTPHLSGCSNRLRTNEGLTFSYDLSNNGIGPAKIKSLQFFSGGKPFPKVGGNYVEAFAREVLGTRLVYQIMHTFNFGNDYSLKAGDSRRLAEIFFPGGKPGEQEIVLDELGRVDLRVEYASLHGQTFVFDTRE